MNTIRTNKTFTTEFAVIGYLILYGIISYLFLELFPLVHSDESWLASHSRTMLEYMDFSVTEAFFDARPRYPHAIKILFHGLQTICLAAGGYSVATVRLLSLLTGLVCLYCFYRLSRTLFSSGIWAFFLMVIFSFDIQFIYASHFARQEIFFVLLILLCLLFFLGKSNTLHPARTALLLGIMVGLSVGFHPNSFIIAVMVGCCYLCKMFHDKSRDLKPLLIFVVTTGLLASVFIGISYGFDPEFLTHYFEKGAEEYGTDLSFGQRFVGLFGFLQRLFLGTGGTYYVADIRLQLLAFLGFGLFYFLYYLVMHKEEKEICGQILILLGSMAGILGGIFLVGRFSQLSIVFLFPAGWLLIGFFFRQYEQKIQAAACILILTIVGFLSAKEIAPFLEGPNYDTYLQQIADFVSPEDPVIGNLNMEFYFEEGRLHDYRNLPYVMDSQGSLSSYIEEHGIQYIFYTDELDYYYAHRPYYNVLYGNIMFAEELRRYCETNCTLVGTFENSRYSPRILELLEQEEYATVSVYRVNGH